MLSGRTTSPARTCAIFAGDVDAGARIFTRIPPAAPRPAIDDPPFPELYSRMASTPICRRYEGRDYGTICPTANGAKQGDGGYRVGAREPMKSLR